MKLWNLQSKLEEKTSIPKTIECSLWSFSPIGTSFVTGGADGKILFWNLDKDEPSSELSEHQGKVNAIAFTMMAPPLLVGVLMEVDSLGCEFK